MAGYHVNLFYSSEDGGFIADLPDLRACSAFGATPEEALAEVERAKAAWLAAARETGKPVPVPRYCPPSDQAAS
jgi:predicted RNase H-like HicB family nuclease